jgi:hypothetical protein
MYLIINRGLQTYSGNNIYNLYVRPNSSAALSKMYVQDTLLAWKLFLYNGLQGGNPYISNSRNNRAFDFNYVGGSFGLIGSGNFDYTLPAKNGTLATTSDIVPVTLNQGTGISITGSNNSYIISATGGSGTSTDTTSLSNRINAKVDDIRRVGVNVQVLKNGSWTTVYTDSLGTGSGTAIDTTSLSNRINTKNDNFTQVAFSTSLQFNTNKISNTYNQTAPLNFTLAGSGNLIGKTIKFTINSNSDTINIPNAIYWKDYYPQEGKINDFELTYRADNYIDVKVSVRNANYSNIITLDTNQASFDTYDGYRMDVITVETDANTTFSMGTAPGATDILKPEFLEVGSHTIYCKAIFYVADTVYINKTNSANVMVSLPNPGLNK